MWVLLTNLHRESHSLHWVWASAPRVRLVTRIFWCLRTRPQRACGADTEASPAASILMRLQSCVGVSSLPHDQLLLKPEHTGPERGFGESNLSVFLPDRKCRRWAVW